MGLFRKSDELFEIMARQKGPRAGSAAGASTSEARPRASSTSWDTPRSSSSSASWDAPRPRSSSTSWDAPRPAASSSWRAPRSKPGGGNSDLYELDGDALVLLEDALAEPEPVIAGDDAVKTYSVRADTAVVGGILFAALLGAAFLMGRNVGGDAPTPSEPTVIRVAAAETPTATRSAQPEQPAAGPSSAQPVPASLPPNTQTSVPASFRASDEEASAPAAARRNEGTTLAAGSPVSAAPKRQAAEGKYVLIVCSTTAENGQKVAGWLNEDAASALANDLSLEAYSTSRGSVRIKGFQERDPEVLARIRATVDPLGGSETFHSAYYVTQR